MSTRRGGVAKGAPKHQNSSTWKPNRNAKKTEKDPGGKLNPYPAITGVCQRCRDQIEWRRKYGKYKLLKEPAKCMGCSKRNVRQPYLALCSACAGERSVCAKCCKSGPGIKAGGDRDKEREEKRRLEEALRSLRERDRRSLLRAMAKGGDPKSMADKAEKMRAAHEGDSEDDEDFGFSDDDEEEDEDEDDAEDDDDDHEDEAEEEDGDHMEDKDTDGQDVEGEEDGASRNRGLHRRGGSGLGVEKVSLAESQGRVEVEGVRGSAKRDLASDDDTDGEGEGEDGHDVNDDEEEDEDAGSHHSKSAKGGGKDDDVETERSNALIKGKDVVPSSQANMVTERNSGRPI